ncbi:TPR-like protein [Fomitiporia mediterranea MF3/22]|uniref:TPR-like protein n=1 Tax=Fomitiporia mediterranea (strain MF3/22) TaxID=694068 RepID=UPI00044098BA|nr:TPR-like protein [Fomitiporia mediterranea MF3/22]EJD00277.1 TPR-like protein [Fomitiporia mediterranea MF3/22]
MSSSDGATEAASVSVLDRVQSFVSEHKQALLLGAAVVVAAGGVAYYAASSSSSSSPPPSEAGDLESGKKKKKRAARKKKAGKGADDGPLIEEVGPQTVDDLLASSVGAEKKSVDERNKLASELKLRGNKAYQERSFTDAVKCYTRAIEVASEPDPVFYSNRAACYMYYPTPEYEKAVEDCTEALRINPKHERSVGRRATALEKLGRYEEALRDFTAITLLTRFSDPKLAEAVERVLKLLTEPKARDIMSKRESHLPPHTFVDAYFGAFRSRPIPDLPENPSTGDNTLKLSLEALAAHDYTHALTLVNEAIEQGISFDAGRAHALNLRGSFRFLMGDSQGAKDDLEAAIAAQPEFTQSLVKIASVHMEQSKPEDTFAAFEQAIKHDPKDPDIYYHRGQVLFIMQEFTQAAENYRKSFELDPTFVFSHIQLAVAQYKADQLSEAMVTFRKALKAFPQRSEPYNYYGELLLDQKRFEDAIEKFDRAIEIEKAKNPPINVLAMVNKGLALFQWKNDLAGAEKIIKEALEADPECEAAVATLAQISLQRGEVEQAMKYFERQVDLARTEADVMNALQFMHAAKAQNEFSRNYPDIAEMFRYAESQQNAALAAGAPPAFL